MTAIDGATPGDLAPTRGLGDAVIDGEAGHIQADHAVIGSQHEREQGIHHASVHPCIPTPAQRAGRHRRISNAVLGATEDQHLDQRVEHEAIGNARAVAAERMRVWMVGQ